MRKKQRHKIRDKKQPNKLIAILAALPKYELQELEYATKFDNKI